MNHVVDSLILYFAFSVFVVRLFLYVDMTIIETETGNCKLQNRRLEGSDKTAGKAQFKFQRPMNIAVLKS